MKRYLKIRPGDEVLLDLGGFGVYLRADPRVRYYDAKYVLIGPKRNAKVVPADMELTSPYCQRQRIHEGFTKGATNVRIYRHRRRS